jgi:hypothetical protein
MLKLVHSDICRVVKQIEKKRIYMLKLGFFDIW